MDKKLIGLSTLFIIAFVLFTGYVFFSGTLSTLTRASSQDNVPSQESSLIFAWPLTVPADGSAVSDVTVFVRNTDGKGLEGHLVTLTSTVGTPKPLTILKIQLSAWPMFPLTRSLKENKSAYYGNICLVRVLSSSLFIALSSGQMKPVAKRRFMS